MAKLVSTTTYSLEAPDGRRQHLPTAFLKCFPDEPGMWFQIRAQNSTVVNALVFLMDQRVPYAKGTLAGSAGLARILSGRNKAWQAMLEGKPSDMDDAAAETLFESSQSDSKIKRRKIKKSDVDIIQRITVEGIVVRTPKRKTDDLVVLLDDDLASLSTLAKTIESSPLAEHAPRQYDKSGRYAKAARERDGDAEPSEHDE